MESKNLIFFISAFGAQLEKWWRNDDRRLSARITKM